VCWGRVLYTKHKKFLPWEITRVFPKREETFPGKVSPEISGENVATLFSEKFSCKSFSRKYHVTNFVKHWFTGCNPLYRYSLLVMLWWNFVEKISRRENFGKSGKLPDDFRAFSGNRSVNQGEKVASGEFRENFSTIFPEIPGKPDRKLPGFGKFPDKFPSEIPEV